MHGSGKERRRKRLPYPSQLSPFPKLVRAIRILQPELRSASGRVVRSIAALHSQAFHHRHHPPPPFSRSFPFPGKERALPRNPLAASPKPPPPPDPHPKQG